MSSLKTFIDMLRNDRKAVFGAVMTRLTNAGMLDWVSDSTYLRLRYRSVFHKKLDLKNPKSFNEKLQWLKLYDRKPEYTMMVDKYRVRDYIADRMGEEYLIPLLGQWERVEDIDFDSLPDQFVLKCNHDSGSVVICRNKTAFDKERAINKLRRGMNRNLFQHCREWPYKNVKPCIIAEAFMQDADQPYGLRDYKFYCFGGEPKLLYVSEGLENHATASISFLNMDWTFAPFRRVDFQPLEKLPRKPAHYEQMIQIAKKLSDGIPFLRVDLYEINGKIYFSELTFSPGSGLTKFEPEHYDEILGSWLVLPEKQSPTGESRS